MPQPIILPPPVQLQRQRDPWEPVFHSLLQNMLGLNMMRKQAEIQEKLARGEEQRRNQRQKLENQQKSQELQRQRETKPKTPPGVFATWVPGKGWHVAKKPTSTKKIVEGPDYQHLVDQESGETTNLGIPTQKPAPKLYTIRDDKGGIAYYKSDNRGNLTPTGLRAKGEPTYAQKKQIDLGNKKELLNYEMSLKRKYPELSSKNGMMDENQKRLLAKDLAAAEEMIINNSENEAVRGHINIFNAYTKEPYMYVWKGPHKKSGDIFKTKAKATRVDLPVINNRQLTAEDVRFTAEKYNKSINEVLKELGVL